MRASLLVRGTGAGGQEAPSVIDLQRVCIDDLPTPPVSQGKGKRRFPAGRGPRNQDRTIRRNVFCEFQIKCVQCRAFFPDLLRRA